MAFHLVDGDPMSLVMTIAEAALDAGVSVRTVNRWAASGRLRVLPGRRVIRREVLAVEAACHLAARRGRPRAKVPA